MDIYRCIVLDMTVFEVFEVSKWSKTKRNKRLSINIHRFLLPHAGFAEATLQM
jgi:hypothetical protein